MDEKNASISKGSIPSILTDALGVSFDTHIGHDFLDDSDERYEFYHRKEKRIPFDLEYFNTITNGGIPNKTLNIALAGTGVGKSLFMCHCAAANLAKGHNVLYITLEMAEERIAERIDANLLDVAVDELELMPKQSYDTKMNRLKEKFTGKLIVKEYPTACAGSANFRHLLNELRIKKNFEPDIIYIDYLNICLSSRIKHGANVNSYTLIKAIAEELRGLAVEYDVPIVSATQTTRSGYSNSDVGLEDTSESFGLPATADFMFALISSEELESLNQIMVKQLKNRYSDPGSNRRFVLGIDRSKMRLYDVDQSAQAGLVDDRPVMDKGKFMEEENERQKPKSKFDRSKFEGFK
jgi:archaellum biogenesis ATPase FlaH